MLTLSILAKIIIALSIFVVWVFRFDNIVNEFKLFKLPDLLRNFVGAAKISLSTLIIASIWYPDLTTTPALLMAFLMFCAQIVHFMAKSTAIKRLPSAALFLLCLFVAYLNSGNL